MVDAILPPSVQSLERLRAILHRFSDARCVLVCGVRSLESQDDQNTDEQACLRQGLALLENVYNDLDSAINAGGAA